MTPLPCPHGMPNAAACTICMEDGPVVVPARWRPIGEPFDAQHAGTCISVIHLLNNSDSTIDVGQRIQRWDRGDGTEYLHEGCAP